MTEPEEKQKLEEFVKAEEEDPTEPTMPLESSEDLPVKTQSEWEGLEKPPDLSETEVAGSFAVDEEEEEAKREREQYEILREKTNIELMQIICYQLKRIADANADWRSFLKKEGRYRQREGMVVGEDAKNQIESLFPADLKKLLQFQDEGDVVLVSFIRYQHDRDLWSRVMNTVRDAGGRWVSAGKNSHWEIPK